MGDMIKSIQAVSGMQVFLAVIVAIKKRVPGRKKMSSLQSRKSL